MGARVTMDVERLQDGRWLSSLQLMGGGQSVSAGKEGTGAKWSPRR